MDTTEDLSARVLVKHILNVEPPRTPLTRSASAKIGSGSRRSSRVNRNDPGAQTPQMMLRSSLKRKIRESISNKSFPSKRRTVSAVLKHTPGPTSVLFDDGDTPRQILKNILLTEPVKSPVVNEQVELQPSQPSPDSSLQSSHPSIEVSGLDLPDLTIGKVETSVKKLTRKRPHRSLNVTAFEKRLKDANDVTEVEESLDDPSSLSLSGLKTPFNDARTERKALNRKQSNRRKVSEDDFGAAVDKREMGKYHGMSSLAPGHVLGETTNSEGFTLGLSKLSEPDISMDIVHCNTALYAKTDAAMSNFSTLATQDKPTVMASQIQRDIMEQQNGNQKPYSFPMEKITLMEDQDRSQSFSHLHMHEDSDKNIAASSQSEHEKSRVNHTFDASESGKVENVEQIHLEEADSQTEEEAGAGTSSESKDEADIQTESESQEDDHAESKNEDPEVQQQSHAEDLSTLRLKENMTNYQSNDEEEEGVEEEEDNEEEEVKLSEDNAEEKEGDEEKVQVEDDMGVVEDVDDGGDDAEDVNDDEAVEMEGDEVETEDDKAEEVEGDVVEDVDADEAVEMEDDEAEEAEGDVVEEAEDDEAEEVEGDEVEELEGDEVEEAEEDDEDEEEAQQVENAECDSPEDENEQHLDNSEHITQRAQSPESELIMPLQNTETNLPDHTEPGCSDYLPASPAPTDEAHVEADYANKENAFQENDLPDDVEQMDESEEEDDQEEIPLKTPAFVKEKRNFFNLDPQASPFAPKNSDAGPSAPGKKMKQKAQRKPRSQKSDPGLPKSYLMNVFKHYAKTKVSADVYPVLKDVMDKFFERLAKDLEAYALHARRSTIEVEDCELLLRRQGHINDKVPVEVLIEKYLRMDQRKLLIPIATSGNVVFPKRR